MKKRFGFLMFFAGLVVILYSICGFFVESRLIASNCNLKCGSNNRVCYGLSYSAYCPCSSQEHSEGKYYANVPTSGSVTGYSVVTYESIVCKANLVCDPVDPVPDKACNARFYGDEFPVVYLCEESLGSTCPEYQVKVCPTQHYMDCVSHFCGE